MFSKSKPFKCQEQGCSYAAALVGTLTRHVSLAHPQSRVPSRRKRCLSPTGSDPSPKRPSPEPEVAPVPDEPPAQDPVDRTILQSPTNLEVVR